VGIEIFFFQYQSTPGFNIRPFFLFLSLNDLFWSILHPKIGCHTLYILSSTYSHIIVFIRKKNSNNFIFSYNSSGVILIFNIMSLVWKFLKFDTFHFSWFIFNDFVKYNINILVQWSTFFVSKTLHWWFLLRSISAVFFIF